MARSIVVAIAGIAVAVGAGYFSHFQYEAWQRIPEVTVTAFCNRNAERAKPIKFLFLNRKGCLPLPIQFAHILQLPFVQYVQMVQWFGFLSKDLPVDNIMK